MLNFKECPKLPKECTGRHNGARFRQSLLCDNHRQVDMWSRGIAEMKEGPVWAGSAGTYRLEKASWVKICEGVAWGSTLAAMDGKVISFGGAHDRQYSNSVKELDEGKMKWSAISSMIVACHDPCVASISCGQLVVMGGMGLGGIALDVVQVFNFKERKWQRGQSLPVACWGASCVVHKDTVIIAGGTGMATSVWCAKIIQLVSAPEIAEDCVCACVCMCESRFVKKNF